MKNIQSAGVVVYRKKDDEIQFLLIRNVKGHWDFPKGQIDLGENALQAAKRELLEEAGITARILDGFEYSYSYFFTDHDGQKAHKTVAFFLGCANDGDIKLSHEHTDFVWLDLEKAVERLCFDEGKDLLKEAEKFI